MKIPFPVALVVLSVGFLPFLSCSSIDDPGEGRATVKIVEDPSGEQKIFIVDITGKEWEVTHAFRQYGMQPELFQHGLGPDRIPPLIHPHMAVPGDTGYPAPTWTGIVIGVTIGGESRAYSITDLNPHEVVDETFRENGRDVHVAVGW